mmetsp:Transcript_20413/g.66291  ORF Transcript_20413/g.66291 Transcript_20413/m.66291 type:complete len:112 (+) Transcript_20413:136-471(+)
MSCSCVPLSMTCAPELAPSGAALSVPTTKMQSALITVERRCATTTVVRRPSSMLSNSSRDSCTSFSDSLSRAEVASSRSRIWGSRKTARAMAMRCFCPPEILLPPAPTSYS